MCCRGWSASKLPRLNGPWTCLAAWCLGLVLAVVTRRAHQSVSPVGAAHSLVTFGLG